MHTCVQHPWCREGKLHMDCTLLDTCHDGTAAVQQHISFVSTAHKLCNYNVKTVTMLICRWCGCACMAGGGFPQEDWKVCNPGLPTEAWFPSSWPTRCVHTHSTVRQPAPSNPPRTCVLVKPDLEPTFFLVLMCFLG